VDFNALVALFVPLLEAPPGLFWGIAPGVTLRSLSVVCELFVVSELFISYFKTFKVRERRKITKQHLQ